MNNLKEMKDHQTDARCKPEQYKTNNGKNKNTQESRTNYVPML